SRAARSVRTASLAAPSAGAALTRRRRWSPRHPTISSRPARGRTSRARRVSGNIALRQGLLDQALVRGQRVHDLLGQLPAESPKAADLGGELRVLLASVLHHLLGPEVRLPKDQLGLAPGILLELLGDLLRGHEGLLESLLPALDALGLLLDLDQLLLEERVFPIQLLDFVGHLLQERVDLLRIESSEEPHRELLLANVRGRQAH